MRRWVYILIGFFALLFILSIVAMKTGALVYFKAASGANEPAFYAGDQFFISNLKDPSLFDFICYNPVDTMNRVTNQIAMHRVCGLPGDEVRILDGNLYINGKLSDSALDLVVPFIISKLDYAKVSKELPNAKLAKEYGTDSIAVDLPNALLKRHSLNAQRVFMDSSFVDAAISKKFNQPWNADNFGPVKVPAASYFVLGDNRANSYDSRYIGFVSKTSIVGVILTGK